jgi:molybdenum cofactor biosynthesis enzyme MoaA
MVVRLFDKNIGIKEYGCNNGRVLGMPIPKSVNLFVKVTNRCNAACRFCSNAGYTTVQSSFDHDKFWRIVDELLANGIMINRINITGGEPSVVPDIVNEILKHASDVKYQGIHLHLNTNGLTAASQKLMTNPRWNSISISLHHYDSAKLSEIYGINIAPDSLSFNNIDINKVNGSCNLLRGYIDSPSEVEKMLNFAISIGLPRLGFVSLMRVNNYCRANYVDFSEIDFETIPHMYFTESRNRGTDCKCSNYLYNNDGKMIEVYMRNYCNPAYCESSLMYDGRYLRQGFQSDNIIY